MRTLVGATILLAGAALLGGCVPTPAPSESLDPVARIHTLSESEQKAIRDGVERHLIDPYSARYEGIVANWKPNIDGMIPVCGLVNAKNLFGAYVGRRHFHGALDRSSGKFIVLELAKSEVADDRVAKTCEEAGLDPYEHL